jgi:Fe-S cluster biogenesis protein NfuA
MRLRRRPPSVLQPVGSAVGDEQQGRDQEERDDHQCQFVPPTLMCEEHSDDRTVWGNISRAVAVFSGNGANATNMPAAAARRAVSIPVQGESPRVDRARVEEVIAIIRPAIQADKGDIRLVDVDEDAGVVKVELQGACVSCPASTQTLKAGIERIMKDRVPGVNEVINVGESLLGPAEGTSVFVR